MSGTSPTSKPTLPNYTQNGAAYPVNIDAAINALAQTGFAFAPSAQDTPNMTVRLEGGAIWNGSTLTEVAAQSTGTFAAPTTNPRIDRVVIDRLTGVVSVVAGTPAASPSPPTIPTGKLPCAQVLLTVGMVAIANVSITDERQLNQLGQGSAATKEADTDGTLAANSDSNIATQKATKTYVDASNKFKVGVFTRDASLASGSQSVTGVGFTPKTLEILATVSGQGSGSTGFSDGVAHQSLIFGLNGSANQSWSNFIVYFSPSTGNSYVATVSFDSDGFTLTWTKTGSPTGTLQLMYRAAR